VTLTFSAQITAQNTGTLYYRWERRDGTFSSLQSAQYTAPGPLTVMETWPVTVAGDYAELLHVFSPNNVTATPLVTKVDCVKPTAVFKINAVKASANPQTYTGTCPASITVNGVISLQGSGNVTYRWERSDGSMSATLNAVAPPSGTLVVNTLEQPTASGGFWDVLHVLTPNDVSSAQAPFAVNCVSATATSVPAAPTATPTSAPPPAQVTGVKATVTPGSYKGKCPTTFTFNGSITTNGAASVTYQWERSDASSSSPQTLTFGSASTQTVMETWTLGGPAFTYNGYEILHVLKPNNVSTNKSATMFSLACS